MCHFLNCSFLGSYERDNETELDFAQSRYYGSVQGRFTSPDSFFGRKTNPQTLNLYAYVLNNPLRWADPTGHSAQEQEKGPIHVGDLGSVEIVDTLPGKKPGLLSRIWGGLKKIGSAIGGGVKKIGSVNANVPALAAEGEINYGALDTLGRPTGVTATITEDMIGTGTPANPSIIPPGWSGNGNLFNEARAHLFGAQLGGSGDVVENLVTLQHIPVNTPFMKGFENLVRRTVVGGQTVNYSSTPIYNGANLVPRGVTIMGTGSGGFTLRVTILNPIGR